MPPPGWTGRRRGSPSARPGTSAQVRHGHVHGEEHLGVHSRCRVKNRNLPDVGSDIVKSKADWPHVPLHLAGKQELSRPEVVSLLHFLSENKLPPLSGRHSPGLHRTRLDTDITTGTRELDTDIITGLDTSLYFQCPPWGTGAVPCSAWRPQSWIPPWQTSWQWPGRCRALHLLPDRPRACCSSGMWDLAVTSSSHNIPSVRPVIMWAASDWDDTRHN